MTLKNDNKYNDIINLPHHISKKYPRMSTEMRSAQFAPFAALTGYDDMVIEEGRITDRKIELTEDDKSVLDSILNIINDNLQNKISIQIKYFVKDKNKNGGKYITKIGVVRKIDELKKEIVFYDKSNIPIDDIIIIELI